MSIIGKQDVKVGEEILLLCKAGGEGEITWKKSGLDIEDEEQMIKIDESTSKLSIKKAEMDDEGRYTCLCEFSNGHSDEVEIQVYVYEDPSFRGTKTFHEFLEGTNVIVPCLVTSRPEVDVSWLRNKQQITTNARVYQHTDNALHIENVMRDDAGTYVCQAQIRGRPVLQTLPVSVVVNAPPKVVLKEEMKKVLARSESNVSLVCLVDGHPKPNITWTL
uniref:Ig-like domain-containing protein n=1 Tax=Echeneis naucrates TaxID=173247 RepID=A0A665TF20_ECHNA